MDLEVVSFGCCCCGCWLLGLWTFLWRLIGVLAFVRFSGLVEIIKFARFDSIGAVF